MGAGHSKAARAHERLVIEQLRQLQLKNGGDSDSDDYDYIDVNEKGQEKGRSRASWTKLSVSGLSQWQHELLQDPKNRLALSALSSADPKAVLLSRATQIEDPQVFNVRIPFEGAPVTNQRASGRCWLFASTNVFRIALMKRHNLDKFELSQAYLFFYDKLEKANYFLENILDTADQELDSQLLQDLLSDPVSDGGQWDMVYNLVTKYGLVPQALYPDSWNAKNSSVINSIIKTKLREDALKLRSLESSSSTLGDILRVKEKMMREIHLILTLTLGPPPSPKEEFTWSYLDKNGSPHELKTTPVDFAAELSSPKSLRMTNSTVSEMFSLVNDPRNKYYSLMTVDRLGNIAGGRGVTYVNIDMATLKNACVKMLQAGLPVFFGSDVGKYSDMNNGIMDLGSVDYELGFNMRLGMSKAQRLRTGESRMTHAMVLTGVHLDSEGKSVRWRVENSYGDEKGSEGYVVMSDGWMDEFVYQAVVEPKFVSKSVRDVLKMEPIVLPHWDAMGSLA